MAIRLTSHQETKRYVLYGDGDNSVWIETRPINALIMKAASSYAAARGDADSFSYYFIVSIAQQSIVAWGGVVEEDNTSAAISPDSIEKLLQIPLIFSAFDSLVATPEITHVSVVELEKNASAPLPSGNMAGAQAIAKRAQSAKRDAPGAPES